MIHRLKLSTNDYDDSVCGIKTCEIRKNNHNYKVGDILELREWIWIGPMCEGNGIYTDRVHWKIITHILEGERDIRCLESGYVCLSVVPIAEPRD